jgi:hypothetical protein
MSKKVHTNSFMDQSSMMNSPEMDTKISDEKIIYSNSDHNKSLVFLKKKRKQSEDKYELEPVITKNRKYDSKDEENRLKKSPEENRKITDFFKQQKVNFLESKNLKNFFSPDRMIVENSFSDTEKHKISSRDEVKRELDYDLNAFMNPLGNLPTENETKFQNNLCNEILKNDFTNNEKKNGNDGKINSSNIYRSDNNRELMVSTKSKKKQAKPQICKSGFKNHNEASKLSSKTLNILSNLSKKKVTFESKQIQNKDLVRTLEKLPLSSKNYLNIKEIQEKYLNSISLKEKFEELLKRELILPTSYKSLLIKSEYIDKAIQKLKQRKCQATLNNIQKLTKEEDFKLIITLENIQEILYLLPWFYIYKSERTEIYLDIPSDIIQKIKVLYSISYPF